MEKVNQEYYELILRHRIYDESRCDPYIEEPVVIKGFTGPFKSDEHEDLVDDMYRKLKEYWLSIREEKVLILSITPDPGKIQRKCEQNAKGRC